MNAALLQVKKRTRGTADCFTVKFPTYIVAGNVNMPRGRAVKLDVVSHESRLGRSGSPSVSITGAGGGDAGGASAPQKFWFSENPGKISVNLGKICENLRKIHETLEKFHDNVGKNGAQNHKNFCLEVIHNTVVMHTKWPKIFSGKFGEIRAKILRTPKNLPAPAPMVSMMMASSSTSDVAPPVASLMRSEAGGTENQNRLEGVVALVQEWPARG